VEKRPGCGADVINVSPIASQTSTKFSPGWGILGCGSGLLAGLLGGGVLLGTLAVIVALLSTLPAPAVTPTPDLRLTAHEGFLNKFIQTPAEGNMLVDILPGNQLTLTVDATIAALGVSIPVQMTGLFQVQLNNQAVEIHLLKTKISQATFPPELTQFFNNSLPGINQELNRALQDVAAGLGVPLTFVNPGSDDTTFWLEANEKP